jgi:4-amino-4-deoxy-L-arabinose transferase-like glycosyltransferase
LLWVALLLVAAGGAAWRPGLHSLDDCFYAQKGVEMARTRSFFTVRWNGEPTWQNPPLQFFWIALSFRTFGRNDPAARLPQLVMAVLLLPMTWFIARRLGLGPRTASLATGMLAATPLLLANASRVMLDIPAAFWCTAIVASWQALRGAGEHRNGAAVLLAVAIAGAVLTKSVLGLLGVAIVGGAAAFERRRPGAAAVVAVVVGTLAGSSWWIHQAIVFGPIAVQQHFVSEIAQRSAARIPWHDRLLAYPRALAEKFQPWVVPGYCGAVAVLRQAALRRGPLAMIAVWLVLPPVLLSFSAAQRPSYLYPILPAVAIASAWWIDRRWPRAARLLERRLLPAALAIVCILRVAAPDALGRRHNPVMAAEAARVAAAISADHAVPNHGISWWRVANPLVYYVHRTLAPPSDSPVEVVQAARTAGGVLFCGSRELDAVRAQAPDAVEIARDRDWILLRVR